jgi:hypothetical protein
MLLTPSAEEKCLLLFQLYHYPAPLLSDDLYVKTKLIMHFMDKPKGFAGWLRVC